MVSNLLQNIVKMFFINWEWSEVERISRTVEDGLAKHCEENQTEWSELMQRFMVAFRSAIHESTGQLPFRVIFGQEMRMPIDFLYPTSTDFRSPQIFQSAIQDKLDHNSQLFDYEAFKMCSGAL